MESIPQRISLTSQTLAILVEGLREGRWQGELPSQADLCSQLMVSRTTLRAALQELGRRGLIEMAQGKPMRVVGEAPVTASLPKSTEVGLVAPEPLWRLRPAVTLWIDELRVQLQQLGISLVLHHGPQFYQSKPERALERLVSQHHHGAWVLFVSHLAMQRWFSQRGIPAVLAGACFPQIELPSVEFDHRGISLHAAQRMRALGHTQAVFFALRTQSAADAKSEDGFVAGFAGGGRGTPQPPLVVYHELGSASIRQKLAGVLALRGREPTAFFVTKSTTALTVLTMLQAQGRQLPRDVSLVCREDDAFLADVVPTVTRYTTLPAAISRKLLRVVTRLLAGESLPDRHTTVMPTFVPGETLGAAPAAKT